MDDIKTLPDEYVKEYYQGKNSILLECEKILGSLIKDMKANPLKDYTNDPRSLKLCDLIKKQFKFGEVYLIWNRSSGMKPTICTAMSVSVLFRNKGDIKKSFSKTGGYIDNHENICVINASSTVVNQIELSAEEYMAILLHEIGHNFDYTMYFKLNLIQKIAMMAVKNLIKKIQVVDIDTGDVTIKNGFNPDGIIPTITSIIPNTKPGKRLFACSHMLVEQILDKLPFLKNIADRLRKIGDALYKGIEIIFAPLTMLAVPVEVLLSPFYHLKSFTERKTEQFADSFATLYGYGVPLHTSLSKLETINLLKFGEEELHSMTGISKIITDLAAANRYLTGAFLDGTHGTVDVRLRSNIISLKNSLKAESYPPKLKKEIENEIKELESLYNAYLGLDDSKQKTITIMCRSFIYRVFGGKTDYIAQIFPDSFAGVTETADDAINDIREMKYKGYLTESEANELIDELNYMKYINE